MLNFLKKIISSIAAFFGSDKVKQALEAAASLVTIAAPIVQEIAALTPNRTVQEIEAAYAKYAVPFSSTILSNGPDATGNALLNLATGLLRDKLPADKATLATNILQTAVQLAVTAIKASPTGGEGLNCPQNAARKATFELDHSDAILSCCRATC